MFEKFGAAAKRVAMVGGTTAVLVAGAAVPSFAATGDGTDGVDTIVSGQFDTLQSTLTGTLIPALFGLVILGVVIGLAIKYLRKGAQKA